MPKDNCQSLNGFTENSLRFYAGYLNTKDASEYLAPVLSQVLHGTPDSFGAHVNRNLFCLSVEEVKTWNVIAGMFKVSPEQLKYVHGKNDPSQSLQMLERPLMMPDELKSLPKGQFIVMKTETHSMQTRLRLFLDWGITFDNVYEVPEKAERKVAYADKDELERQIVTLYHSDKAVENVPVSDKRTQASMSQQQSNAGFQSASEAEITVAGG